MQLFGHRVTGGEAEVRVLGQYLDGKLHLVGDSLSKGLFFRPQFKIRQRIVFAVAIFVMNCLVFFERTFQMFRHYAAMHQNLAASAQMQAHIARRVVMSLGVYGAPRSPLPSTFFTAKFLPSVVAGGSSVLGAAHATFNGFVAQLTLKCRNWVAVHKEQLPDSFAAVKGVV